MGCPYCRGDATQVLERVTALEYRLFRSLLSETRDMGAAKHSFQRARTVVGHAPGKVTTDGHDAYPRAIRETLGPEVQHRTSRYMNNHANALRRRRPRPGDTWHLDEVFLKINGQTHYLRRAVDQEGNVLDILVQSRRNATAAKRFFRKLLKGLCYVPRVLITDKPASYGVAHKEMLPPTEHRRSEYLNNRAENSHQPTRQQERAMKRFTSPGHAQRFLSAFGGISGHFRPRRHRLSARAYRAERATRMQTWQEITGTVAA